MGSRRCLEVLGGPNRSRYLPRGCSAMRLLSIAVDEQAEEPLPCPMYALLVGGATVSSVLLRPQAYFRKSVRLELPLVRLTPNLQSFSSGV
jgi:hypothetical protein